MSCHRHVEVPTPAATRPRGASAASKRRRARVAGYVRVSFWILMILWTVGVLSRQAARHAEAGNAVQQTAASAETCVALIVGYLIVRAVDALTREIER
jgi:hypothetical protein